MSLKNASSNAIADGASATAHEAAFSFAIDGHPFVAMSDAAAAHADKAEPRPRVVGRIFTAEGSYLILDEGSAQGALPPALVDTLSRREIQVALHIAEGRCDKEIARALGISSYTVREHIRRIFSKLRVARRSAIAQHVLGMI